MARSIATIKQQIIEAKNAETSLSGLTSTSQTAIWNLWVYITAVAINLHEQLWDIFRTEIEGIAAKVVPGTAEWLAAKVLEFQYDALDPQELKLVNFVPTYDIIREERRIVAKCAIREVNRQIFIKVAKLENNQLTPLSTEEKSSLEGYIDRVKFAGTSTTVETLFADKIQVHAKIFYDGQYSLTFVKGKVKEAINNYFQNLPFDGVVYTARIMDAIQGAMGVKDVILKNIVPRTASETIANYSSNTAYINSYATAAGYVKAEDTTGHTLEETLEFETL